MASGTELDEVPVIDVAPLVRPRTDAGADEVGRAIDAACRQHGFFSVVGHGLDPDLLPRLDRLARELFARPEEAKARIAMARGGRAWRGWFPVGGELTSGTPDRKEGLYLGTELGPDDPRVRAGTPLHGPNLWPDQPAELRPTVLAVLDALGEVAQVVLEGMARGLGLAPGWFRDHLTADPVVLFRIFHYPPAPADGPDAPGGTDETAGTDTSPWGVGEHTDYGLLTLLHQDATGGLEVRRPDGTWAEVPPAQGALVCNLGDMLERMTGGRYRSTPHRVRSPGDRHRISCPFFFDPSWDAVVEPLPLDEASAGPPPPRWDGADPGAWGGTYGEYLLAKVSRVFPDLGESVL